MLKVSTPGFGHRSRRLLQSYLPADQRQVKVAFLCLALSFTDLFLRVSAALRVNKGSTDLYGELCLPAACYRLYPLSPLREREALLPYNSRFLRTVLWKVDENLPSANDAATHSQSSYHCSGHTNRCAMHSVSNFYPKSRHRTSAIGRAGYSYRIRRRTDAKSFSLVSALLHCSQTCICLVGSQPTVLVPLHKCCLPYDSHF